MNRKRQEDIRSTGIYFYRIKAGDFEETRKLLLVKWGDPFPQDP
jgi:hypothetical protein